MLGRHLFVGRQQDDIIQPSAGPVQVVLKLQDMSVYEERFARAGCALKGEGAQVVRFKVRHGCRLSALSLGRVQVGAQRLGVGEITVQVMFGEQQGKILIGLPFPLVLAGHTQFAAMRSDVGVVCGKLFGGDIRPSRIRIQRAGVFAFAAGVEVGRRVTQPFEHGVHVVVAELSADKAIQGETVLEGGGSCLALA